MAPSTTALPCLLALMVASGLNRVTTSQNDGGSHFTPRLWRDVVAPGDPEYSSALAKAAIGGITGSDPDNATVSDAAQDSVSKGVITPDDNVAMNITREFYTLNLPFVKLGATSKVGTIPSNTISFLPPLPSGNMVFLKNTYLRVGFNLDAGAGLSFLGAYQGNPNFSYVNAYDAGRMMQQSYYGNEDGSFWDQTPWRYNPVQAGSWHTSLGNWTYLSKTLAYNVTDNQRFLSQTTPRLWAQGTMQQDVLMEQAVTFVTGHPAVLRAGFRVRYTGLVAHQPYLQEVPALFVWRGFTRLATFTGRRPFVNRNPPVIFEPPNFPGQEPRIHTAPERWAAYLLPEKDWGIGIYFPYTDTFTCYTYGPYKKNMQEWTTSYIAPVTRFALRPGLDYDYVVYVMFGTLQEIRSKFVSFGGRAPP